MKFEEMDKSKENLPTYEKKENIVAKSQQQTFVEVKPEKMNLNILQNNLGNCLSIIDEEVMKGYVTRLDELPIIIQDGEVYDKLMIYISLKYLN